MEISMSAFDRVRRACWLGLLVVVFGAMPLAHAQTAPSGLPDADKQQIKKYTLNEDIFNRLVAATKEARAEGITPRGAPDPSKVHSLDDLAAQAMAGDQRIPALVKKFGFTPREFMLANIALTNAVLAVQSRNDPALASNLNQVWVNPENIRFIDTHQAEVAALMQGGAEPQPSGQAQ
jgi:hypothetical protein